MKRLLLIFMCLSLFICLLVSCGKTGDNGDIGSSGSDVQSSSTNSSTSTGDSSSTNSSANGSGTNSSTTDSSTTDSSSGGGNTDDGGSYTPDMGSLKYQYNMEDYVTLPSYGEYEIKLPLDEIQRAIDNYIMQYASSSRKTICMTGDVVRITYFGYKLDENGEILYENGKEVTFDEGDTGVYLGARFFLEEFENGIVGMKIGDIKQIYVTFPEDYHDKEMAGERVIFEVILNAIYEPPVYNDEFVKLHFNLASTKEFENGLVDEFVLNAIYEYIKENTVIISYPEKEYNEEAESLEELEKSFEELYDIDLDEYIMNQYGMTREEYIKSNMKVEMIFYAIAEKEGIVPTEDELLAERSSLIEYYTEEYVANGVDYREATVKAQEFVDALGVSYIYENVIYSKVDEKMSSHEAVVKEEMSYKSITQYLSEREGAETGSEIGDLCPSFEAEVFDENGSLSTTIDPTKNYGKLTVINFWGTWCGPCKSELPDFDRIATEYKDQVTFFAVHSSYNFKDASEYVLDNFASSEMIFLKDIIKNPNDLYSDDIFYELLGGADYYPYTVVLDENGVIRARHFGMLSYNELVNILVNIGLER